jgi:excisionase family DNA binding protein
MNHGGDPCISFGGMRVDRAISAEIIARLQPLGIRAALAALEARDQEHAEKLCQLDLALEQARYEAARSQRQYDAIDPDNRLVAGELERRWNERLLAVRALENEREVLLATPEATLSAADRERLLALGADLELAWDSPGATAATRKRIIRTLIHEIIVHVRNEMLDLVIHWHGSDHTALQVRKNRKGQHRWSTSADVVDLVRVLARQMPDNTIAAVLNRAGKSTGRGNSWTRVRVRSLRNQHTIAAYREGERAERGEVTLDEAAAALKVSPSTVRRLIEEQSLPAQQLCKGAPWVIKSRDLERPEVKQVAQARRLRRPASADPRQKELEL